MTKQAAQRKVLEVVVYSEIIILLHLEAERKNGKEQAKNCPMSEKAKKVPICFHAVKVNWESR
jgi:hypothetical protein